MKVRCNWCEAVFDENQIVVDEETERESCPMCGGRGYLQDIPENNIDEDNTRNIIVYIRETTYGTVQITVDKDATEEEIISQALEAVSEGGTCYTSNKVDVVEWKEDKYGL